MSADAETGPFDLSRVHALTDERLYSGRLVRQRDGQWACWPSPQAARTARSSAPSPILCRCIGAQTAC